MHQSNPAETSVHSKNSRTKYVHFTKVCIFATLNIFFYNYANSTILCHCKLTDETLLFKK